MKSVLFQFLGLSVHSYGLMLAIAFLVAIAAASKSAKKIGVSSNIIIDLATWILVGAVLGSRLAYVITEYHYFSTKPWWEIFMISSGGLAFHGGLIGGFFAGWWFLKIKKLHPWKIADLVTPYIALGYAIVRIGCFLNGCCYGKVTNLPWAVQCSANDMLLRHPTQLYSCLGSQVIFVILLIFRNHRQFPGFLFLLYIGLYSVMRYIVEIFRESPMISSWLSLAQLVCLVLVIISVGLTGFFEWRYHKVRNSIDAVSEVQS